MKIQGTFNKIFVIPLDKKNNFIDSIVIDNCMKHQIAKNSSRKRQTIYSIRSNHLKLVIKIIL
jgi:hypothetical protein